MEDLKLFRLAAGRRFQIQAVSRHDAQPVVLARDLSEDQVRAWEPTRGDRQSYKNFRVAYARSEA